jgi:hypothetical protein
VESEGFEPSSLANMAHFYAKAFLIRNIPGNSRLFKNL